jgi:hypothetical protein
MSCTQFRSIRCLYLDMHGLRLEVSGVYSTIEYTTARLYLKSVTGQTHWHLVCEPVDTRCINGCGLPIVHPYRRTPIGH